ncbi:MAG: nucleotidyltransferase family protein [Brevinematales bacterium]|nr:nucleotidyltransferase family protein [Brevinematales bacterium]
MNREEILSILHAHRGELRELGLKRIGVFGSSARNEASEDSDIDMMAEFEQDKLSYRNYMKLYDFLIEITRRKIDLLTPGGVSPYIKPYIDKEIVYEEL